MQNLTLKGVLQGFVMDEINTEKMAREWLGRDLTDIESDGLSTFAHLVRYDYDLAMKAAMDFVAIHGDSVIPPQ